MDLGYILAGCLLYLAVNVALGTWLHWRSEKLESMGPRGQELVGLAKRFPAPEGWD
jgi:hypothetical protein